MPDPGSQLPDLPPFLWLGAFVVCLTLHLIFHPLAPVFRQALQWLGRHPAPVLWLWGSVAFLRWWELTRTPLAEPAPETVPVPHLAPWPEVFLSGLAAGWQQFGLLFHRVLAVPSFWPGHWAGTLLQALLGAFTQVWFACYLINTRNIFTEEGLSFRQALVRWPNVLLLAACQWPWWWISQQDGEGWRFAKQWFLPEYLLFLAPVPLAIAMLRGSFVNAGEQALRWWQARGLQIASLSITALPMLALLHFCLGTLPDMLLEQWPIARLLLEGGLIATVHLWLFVSAALLLLWGGYVEDAPVPLEEA